MNLRILNKLRYYIIREIIKSEHTVTNTLDSLALLILQAVPLRRIRERMREHRLRHCANHITKKWEIKLAYPPGGFSLDICWNDYFQIPEILKNRKVVVDVGASIGEFSIIMAKAFQANKVIAIEPEKIYFKYLKLNIIINKMANIILPVDVALGEEEEF